MVVDVLGRAHEPRTRQERLQHKRRDVARLRHRLDNQSAPPEVGVPPRVQPLPPPRLHDFAVVGEGLRPLGLLITEAAFQRPAHLAVRLARSVADVGTERLLGVAVQVEFESKL